MIINNEFCGTCNRELGSNPRCRKCMESYVSDNSNYNDYNMNDAYETIDEGERFIDQKNNKAPSSIIENCRMFIDMLKDIMKGNYTKMPVAVISMIIFIVIYIVNPMDLIPDFIPGVGYIDDLMIMNVVLSAMEHDINLWRNK